jgi:L-alanine-DL-glutamate epimerase-like enolase superfamily enzyme
MSAKSTDCRVVATTLYFLPIELRMPLKFGAETVTHVSCARAKVTVRGNDGRTAEGWGETPLSASWVWPSKLPIDDRRRALEEFCVLLAEAWARFETVGHPIRVGHAFQEKLLPALRTRFNAHRAGHEPMPWLAALVCCSLFDLALHDAFGQLHGVPVFETYGPEYMNEDLTGYLEPAAGTRLSFSGKYPRDYFRLQRAQSLPAWHLVGGVDPLETADLTGTEPNDGYPVLLADWIKTDGLRCLKIKLRGTDAEWDFARTVRVGRIALEHGVEWLTADFNCTVHDPAYVNAILDRLRDEEPRLYGMLLYVEQPFPYELEEHSIDVHSVGARKPLFLDESAHDWQHVRLGRSLGWTGVALKTCKTLTGALLSACWAQAHGMTLMVQDLTNPMLAQVPHVLLAAHVPTIMGVETNGMQFYPAVSAPEAAVHPGIYRRRGGALDLSTIRGPGLGYRVAEMSRNLPKPAVTCG